MFEHSMSAASHFIEVSLDVEFLVRQRGDAA